MQIFQVWNCKNQDYTAKLQIHNNLQFIPIQLHPRCSSLSGDALQDYLVVRHDIAPVAKFDVRPAAVEEWTSRRERRPRQDRNI